MYQAGRRHLAIAIMIGVRFRFVVSRSADDIGIACHIHQILMRVMMAQSTIMGRDLDREGPHQLVRDDEMVARFLLDGDHVLAGILISVHRYSFEGLNSTTTSRMS